MSQTYTEGFTIVGASGTSAGCSALLNATTTSATAIIVPWRNVSGATCSVSLAAGQILPIKTREVKSSTQNLTGLN